MRITNRKAIALAGASLIALSAGTALATAPSGEKVKLLARGAVVKPAAFSRKVAGGSVTIKTSGALDALMANVTLAPGGTGGWHKNAGPLINVVKHGTLTVIDAKCKRHDVPAGHAVISPGSTDKIENRGSTPVVFSVTFLIPHAAMSPDISQPAPAGCTA